MQSRDSLILEENIKNQENQENRRRSISVFTLNSNSSSEHPKRRSFSSNRRSFSYSLTHNTVNSNNVEPNNENINYTNNNNNINNNIQNNNTHTHSSLNYNKTRSNSHKMKSNSRPNSRFFSSPQFSTSTPNLLPKISKYIDSELRISNKSIDINSTSFIIPTYVYKCCDFIKLNPPLEGLFRMNGSIKQVNLIESKMNKNIDSFNFENDHLTTSHDVAVILKRWISNLDYGLITADVCNSLSQIRKDSIVSDYPSELDDDDHDHKTTENNHSINIIINSDIDNNFLSDSNSDSENIEDNLIDMDQFVKISDSPMKKNKSNETTPGILTPDSLHSFDDDTLNTEKDVTKPKLHSDILIVNKSIYSASLSKLPIENLHLLLFLLDFLKYLSSPEISSITKMHDSNLSKVFQLNFFKSVDLTIGSKSFSTDDLKSSYLNNEELLTSMINQSDLIIEDLSSFIKERQSQINLVLNLKDHQQLSPTSTGTSPNQKLTFTSAFFSKRRNNSTSSFTNNKNQDIYSLPYSRNSSLDNLPENITNFKNISPQLETCMEKDIRTNVNTPKLKDGLPGDEVLAESIDNGGITKSAIHQRNNNIDIHNHENNHYNNNSDHNPSTDLTTLQQIESHIDHTRKTNHTKRKSIFGLFNKRKSSIPNVESISQDNSKSIINSSNLHEKADFDTRADNTRSLKDIDDKSSCITGNATEKAKKSPDIMPELQMLHPTEEIVNKQESNHNETRHHDEKSNTNHDKHSQRRFSLFKFRRSS
jgi:hypothetical protein